VAELERSGAGAAAASPAQMAEQIEELREQLVREKRINELLRKTLCYFAREQ